MSDLLQRVIELERRLKILEQGQDRRAHAGMPLPQQPRWVTEVPFLGGPIVPGIF